MRQNVIAQLQDYRGVLHWNQFTDGKGNVRKAIDVPLYIKENPIPIRKPKLTEISTIQTMDPITGADTSTQALFLGTPDPLQITISGWVLTPYVNNTWVLKATDSSIFLPGENISYGDLISAYIEGRLNLTAGGYWQRKDPDYFITPYGQQYINPVISTWESQYTTNPRKQSFTMTLYLEQ